MHELLKRAASRAGVSEKDAASLIRELSTPTMGLCQMGEQRPPPFSWPAEHADLYGRLFPTWAGLTPGEYDEAVVGHYWSKVCEGLLNDQECYPWEHETTKAFATPPEDRAYCSNCGLGRGTGSNRSVCHNCGAGTVAHDGSGS